MRKRGMRKCVPEIVMHFIFELHQAHSLAAAHEAQPVKLPQPGLTGQRSAVAEVIHWPGQPPAGPSAEPSIHRRDETQKPHSSYDTHSSHFPTAVQYGLSCTPPVILSQRLSTSFDVALSSELASSTAAWAGDTKNRAIASEITHTLLMPILTQRTSITEPVYCQPLAAQRERAGRQDRAISGHKGLGEARAAHRRAARNLAHPCDHSVQQRRQHARQSGVRCRKAVRAASAIPSNAVPEPSRPYLFFQTVQFSRQIRNGSRTKTRAHRAALETVLALLL